MMAAMKLDGNALKFSGMATTRIAGIDVTPRVDCRGRCRATASGWKVTTNMLEAVRRRERAPCCRVMIIRIGHSQ